MAIIVEDGSNVANANSYCTLLELREYSLKRGVTLTASDSELETHSVKAMDYLEAKRDDFKGTKTYTDQALQWPRIGVVIDGVDFPETSIPIELKNAQAQLVIESVSGINLMPTVEPGGYVIEEQIGALKTKYSNKLRTSAYPKFAVVEAWLKAVCKNSSYFKAFRV